MKKPNATELLEERIKALEAQQAEARLVFRRQLAEAGDSLRPSSIIRNMIRNSVSDDEVKAPVLDSAIGVATGFVAKKVLLGSVHNPITKIAANLIQAGVSAYVAKHPDAIKNAASRLMGILGKKKEDHGDQQEDHE